AVFPLTLSDQPDTAAAVTAGKATVPSPPVPSSRTSTTTSDDERPTIMVVEDNLDLQAYLRMVLKDNYHLVLAGHGQQALDYLKDAQRADGVSLILSDLMMPVMDGLQLLTELKRGETTRHIPVIMLTARAEKDDRLRALRIGVDDYLTKPFDEEELRVRIANLLAHQSVRRAVSQAGNDAGDTLEHAGVDEAWLDEFEQFVTAELASKTLTVTALAKHFSMSESTLLRQVTRLTGLSTRQYLQEVRLHTARQILENQGVQTVAQAASEVGYSDSRAFSRAYKARFGRNPGEVLARA
ncbi:MAG: response regulator, partial [Lewinella sp.]|nr:response regulator [Lewinella sp.]